MDLGVDDEIMGILKDKEKIKMKTQRSKKPKMKKYTPKVIREVKVKVKSVVRAPKTPAKSKEKTPLAKRKYVRKKKNVEVTIQEIRALAPLSGVDGSVGDIKEQDQCVKRKLDFDIEEETSQVIVNNKVKKVEVNIRKTPAPTPLSELDGSVGDIKEQDQSAMLAPLSEVDASVGDIEEQDQCVKRKLGFDIEEEKAQAFAEGEEKVWITYERRRRRKKEEKVLIKTEKTILTYVRRKKKDLCSVLPSVALEEKINVTAMNCRGRKRSYSLLENSMPGRNFPVQKRSKMKSLSNSGWGNFHALQRVIENYNVSTYCSFFPEIHKKRRTEMFRSVRGRSLCGNLNAGILPVICKRKRTSRMKKHASICGGWKNIQVIQNYYEISNIQVNEIFDIQVREALDCMPTLCEEKEKDVVVQGNIPCTEPLTPMKEPECRINQQNWSYGPQARIEALISMQMKPKARRHKKKEQVLFVNVKLGKPVSIKEVNDIVRKLNHLNINGDAQSQMAIVPFAHAVGEMVSFTGRKKKEKQPIPQVDLDPESSRVWELWMVTGKSDGDNVDADRVNWWEEERRVLSGRVCMFIARMRLILGDRSFSRWKGSVVDSVTGVFLTQNVSDHLSSSAFMSLAARFPLQSKSNNETSNAEVRNKLLFASINDRDEPTSNQSHEITNMKNISTTFQQQEREEETKVERTQHDAVIQTQIQNCETLETYSESQNGILSNKVNPIDEAKSSLRNEECTTQKGSNESLNGTSKGKKSKAKIYKKNYDWDRLRKEVLQNGISKEQSEDNMDFLNYDAVRCAEETDISAAIKERGQHSVLALRIKEFLNRIYRDHGSLNLEWLRDVPPIKVKDYLLSIEGLGLKSVECVRLLSLHHVAFPVDTNVGRICVRLGWVPLKPLPESLQFHKLKKYPELETIQMYLWPRLCKLDQETLYNLHYMLITFGKVFCTKSMPNCNACPMRGECKHYASACASSRFALPRPDETSSVSSSVVITSERAHIPVSYQNSLLPQLEEHRHSEVEIVTGICEPVIEEPTTPEPECFEPSDMDIEDFFSNDPDEIPTLDLLEGAARDVKNYMQDDNMEFQDGNFSRALVALTPEAASVPMPKLKNVGRLRTEHQAYLLPDDHPLLEEMDKREPDDPCPYLLAIWTPGETAHSVEPPKSCCSCKDGQLCYNATCLSCNSIREAQAQTVRGTIMIPSRTANRGRFPLNGTYFQVNEVFADHYTSYNPINVPTYMIWHLERRTVCFGSSVASICKGRTTEEIQYCFRLGYICHRGYDRVTRRPRALCPRLHTQSIVRAKEGSSKTGKGKRSTPQNKKTKATVIS